MSEQKDKIGGGWDKVGDALSKASGTIGAGAKKAAEAAAVGAQKAKEAASVGVEKARQAVDDVEKRAEERKAAGRKRRRFANYPLSPQKDPNTPRGKDHCMCSGYYFSLWLSPFMDFIISTIADFWRGVRSAQQAKTSFNSGVSSTISPYERHNRQRQCYLTNIICWNSFPCPLFCDPQNIVYRIFRRGQLFFQCQLLPHDGYSRLPASTPSAERPSEKWLTWY